MAEYEAVIVRLELTPHIPLTNLRIFDDLELIIKNIREENMVYDMESLTTNGERGYFHVRKKK